MTAIIQPFDDNHAISDVVFSFEFAEAVAAHDFVELRANGSLHKALKQKLPRFNEQQQITFNFGPEQHFFAAPVTPPGIISGVVFDKVKPDGDPEFAINIQANSIVIVCGKYTRWAGIWAQVEEYLGILSTWLKDIKLSAVSLQYTDFFRVNFKNGERLPLSDLFSENSIYIPANFKNITQAFHSHHGFFLDPEYEIPGKLLTNVNINVIESSGTFDTNIICSHKYHFFTPTDAAEQSDQSNDSLGRCFKYLHDVNKEVVGDLLTENVKGMINFNDSRSE